jgi:hypothetical protein
VGYRAARSLPIGLHYSGPRSVPTLVALAAALSNGNRIALSQDFGRTWQVQPTPQNNAWNRLAWAPEIKLLVAVASNGANRVMTSPDGQTWTARNAADARQWFGVAWSPSLRLFAAVADSGVGNRVMTSPDGINWTLRATPADLGWQLVTWVEDFGLFVAFSNTVNAACIMTSPDGLNWTQRAANGALQAFAYNGSILAARNVNAGGDGFISGNGTVWAPMGPENGGVRSMAFGAARWVALGPNDANQQNSVDALVWAAMAGVPDTQWLSMLFASSEEFIAVENGGTGSVLVSPSGVSNSWTQLAGVLPVAQWVDVLEARLPKL